MFEAGPEADEAHLSAAIRLGASALGTTWPNPAVGAILVRDGIVVGRGRTAPGGRPHAEEIALAQAGERARGAACYVSLEPCAWRSDPSALPCSQALAAAGVARIVMPIADPNPRVNDAGRARLLAAGIDVHSGLLEAEARHAHRFYLTRLSLGRPHVVLKLAVSADDGIGRLGERQAVVTGEVARRHVQALRARADAVMVGSGTLKADDPLLTCRLPDLAHRSPVRIVVATDGRIDTAAAVMAPDSPVPTWIVSAAGGPADAALPPPRFRRIHVPPGPGGVDLPQALRLLGEASLTSVLVEGGATLARALLDADLVDEALIFRSPVVLGRGRVPALGDLPMAAIERSAAFRRLQSRAFGPDRLTRFERVR